MIDRSELAQEWSLTRTRIPQRPPVNIYQLMKVKIVSWNIWVDGLFDKWKDFLQSIDADIIGLQEVKDDDLSRDIIGLLTKLGYNYVFARTEQIWDGKLYRHGPALFSKFPVTYSEKIQLEKGDNERAAIYGQIKINDSLLNVFSAHLIHTHQQPSKQQENQVTKLIAKLPKEKVIVMGDFNATPKSRTVQLMKKVLIDTNPSDLPTWSVYPAGCSNAQCNPQKIDTKLDYIFVSGDIKINSFEVGKSEGSDHLPILTVIEV